MGLLAADEARRIGSRMAQAAKRWTASLDETQHDLGVLGEPSCDDSTVQGREWPRWYYTPTHHGGLPLQYQRPEQQSLALQLVETGLSRQGFATVSVLMGWENILDALEGWRVDWGRRRGRDPSLFFVRVFGDPDESDLWGWRFGGHHVSLSYVINAGGVVSVTPSFLGADPARTVLVGGQELRPLGELEDRGRAVYSSLSNGAAKRALLHESAVPDIVTGNRPTLTEHMQMIPMRGLWRNEYENERLREKIDAIDRRAAAESGYGQREHETVAVGPSARGVAAAEMGRAGRDGLRGLLAAHVSKAPEKISEAIEEHYASDSVLDEVHFAWSGSVEEGKPHYYRLECRRFIFEYNNTQRSANHAHSVWRDREMDLGSMILVGGERRARDR